jgi:hypothetical protein
MTIVAHAYPFVIGVDAHARNHAVAVLACPTGEVVDEAQFPATVAGLQRAVSWVARRTRRPAVVMIENGTYGARLGPGRAQVRRRRGRPERPAAVESASPTRWTPAAPQAVLR